MTGRDPVFVDTSGWIALLNTDELRHHQARSLLAQLRQSGRSVTTTDWVIAETGNSLANTSRRVVFRAFVEDMLSIPSTQFVRIHSTLFDEAIELYDRVRDKHWGLVDCASFVVMRREGIEDVVTLDHHFQLAGFRLLLDPH